MRDRLQIAELEIPIRVWNVLTRDMGLKYVDELVQLTPTRLLLQPNFGVKSLKDLEVALAVHQLSLAPDERSLPKAAIEASCSKQRPAPETTERNRDIFLAWLSGNKTMQRIAEERSLSRGRVWQIVAKERMRNSRYRDCDA